jgi:hypothetical protein
MCAPGHANHACGRKLATPDESRTGRNGCKVDRGSSSTEHEVEKQVMLSVDIVREMRETYE